ncbi:hypothetical protein [Saccharopolyspora mangrovi]|uniref:Uncharacterized protein n=1 Tax=Saccharopolyspora mangrovi TaxID=3082379 RepID=A0ABU6A764_9PSEU|nr:hypothetical protein [Saccharopolyspora sp. S2-29]MEB3367375.1 hypothetical protein [Saccharopolyspora sp. S2-29]
MATEPWDDDAFDPPGAGSLFVNADNEGRLLLITPNEYDPNFTTKAGTGPAVRGDVVVLDGPDAPVEYENSLLFGKVFTGQLRKNCGTGKPNLGRFGLGEKKPGQNAPWQLATPTEEDKKLARKYLASKEETPF